MRGTSRLRQQGYKDPLLVKVLEKHGLKEVPLYKHRPPETLARMTRWNDLGKERDGPLGADRVAVTDIARTTAEIKAVARELGADVVGCAPLTPVMFDHQCDLPHANIIAVIVGEDYGAVLGGPRAIETQSTSTYVRCAEISTALARHIRAMGYPAIAHHNGAGEIQAIPAMHACGFGELGKHGSLIHPDLGASHRPGFVTTDLPLAPDAPIAFGVQDYCERCNLCANNCPSDAIPASGYVLTEGIKRWLTDVEKCYVTSRLRAQYCHICVDVCPYAHKMNGDADRKQTYKTYMWARKKAGYKTPAWFPEDPPPGLAG